MLYTGALPRLGGAATTPQRLTPDRNVDRYEQMGQLDTKYLLSLSTDVEPALARLPEPMQRCARYRDDDPDPWFAFNL